MGNNLPFGNTSNWNLLDEKSSWDLLQDKPESFEMVHRGSPLDTLRKVSEVLTVYWELAATSDSPVDWRCQDEYSETFSSPTEELPAESTSQYFTGV